MLVPEDELFSANSFVPALAQASRQHQLSSAARGSPCALLGIPHSLPPYSAPIYFLDIRLECTLQVCSPATWELTDINRVVVSFLGTILNESKAYS